MNRPWGFLISLLVVVLTAVGLTLLVDKAAGVTGANCRAINHRGLTDTGRENQLAGVTRGGRYGWAEVDATVLGDGTIAGIHDRKMGRLTDGDLRGFANEYTFRQINAKDVAHPFGKFRRTTSLIGRAARDNVPLMITINHWKRIRDAGGVELQNQVLDTLYAAAQNHPRPWVVWFGGFGPQDAMRLRHPDAATFWRYAKTWTPRQIRRNQRIEQIPLVALPGIHWKPRLVKRLKANGARVATRQVRFKQVAREAQAAGINIVQGNNPERIATRWCR